MLKSKKYVERGEHMPSILIVEDELPINDLMKMNLTLVGYTCDQAFDGAVAKEKMENNQYDLIILDIMLPHFNGFQLMEMITDTPVLFVTARDNLQDKIKAFSIGAQDYIVKPFEILELVARVNVVLKRNKKESKFFELDHIKVDLEGRKVYDQEQLVKLTHQEYDLLEVFINNRNLALSREQLLELAWDMDYGGDTRTVDVHVQKLRKKLGLEHRIVTVFKHGYRLEV